jgi:transposase-like protein
MGQQQRRRFSSKQKVEILREVLENGKKMSDVAEEHKVSPNMITRWKKQLFEGALDTFNSKREKTDKKKEKKIATLQENLQKRDTLIAELVEQNTDQKKKYDGDV